LDQRNDSFPEKYKKDLFTIEVPFFGKASCQFSKRFCSFVKTKFHLDINVYYKYFKNWFIFLTKISYSIFINV